MDIFNLRNNVILVLSILCKVHLTSSYSTGSAGSLYTALTYGYNSLVRPSGTTSVSVRLGILSVNYLDIQTGQFFVTGWLDVSWTDSRFSWTPASFSGISEMYLGSTNCWNPKVIVDNAFGSEAIFSESSYLFKIGYSGGVTLSVSGEFTMFCPVDVTYYPYDVQNCFVSVKSWSFPAAYVDLTSGGLDLGQFTQNDEWEVTSHSVKSESVSVNSVSYSNLKFLFKLKRRSAAFMLMLLMPIVLVSLLGLCVFMIPPECTAKLGFSVAMLVAQVLLLGMISNDAPLFGQKVPILGMYLLVLILLSLMELFMTIVILKTYYNKDRSRTLPSRLERLAGIFNFITCHKPDDQSATSTPSSEIESALESPQATGSSTELKHPIKRRLSLKTISPDCSFATSSKEEFRAARRRSRAWGDNGPLCGGGSDRKYTWEECACALDRFCFLLFVLVRFLFTLVFLIVLTIGAS